MQKKKPIGLLTGALALAVLVTTVLATTAFAANAASVNNNTQANVTAATDTTNSNTASDAATAKDVDTDTVDSTDKQDVDDVENETQDNAENETQDTEKEADENVALAAKATVTEQEAVQIAEKANSGYTFIVNELGSDNGVIAYELKGTDAAGKTLEIHVDASSGALLQESDSEYDD